MIVKSFLQLSCLRQEDFNSDTEWMMANIPFTWELSVRDFYNQPFKPEMITEYFEGWEDNLDGEYYCERQPNCMDMIDIKGGFTTYWRLDNDKKWYTAKTLDRFICHCQDAGIELIWKEPAK